MQHSQHFQSFWFSKAIQNEVAVTINELRDHIKSDICIVGGGFTGLWTALKLKEKNPSLKITLIDKGLCGSGASGRNGGCMITLSTKYTTMKSTVGKSNALLMVRATENAAFNIKNFCEKNNIDAQVRLDGMLFTATNQTQQKNLVDTIQELEEHDIAGWTRWSKNKVQRSAGSCKHIDGYFSPIAGSLQPALLARGMKKVAEEKGILIFENTPMIKIEEGKNLVIHTPSGSIVSNKAVMAINAWMPKFFPTLSRSVILVSSDMFITEPIPKKLEQIGLSDGKAIIDSCLFTHYYRTTLDGHLMFGKGGNLFPFNNKVIPAFEKKSRYEKILKVSFNKFFPTLSSVPLICSWTGPSERTKTGFPFFGRLRDKSKIIYGFGYSGNGILPSYVGGEILSSMALDEDNEWTQSAFCRGPLDMFPPEPFRSVGAITIRNAIRRKEIAEDKNKKPLWIDKKLAKLATSIGRINKN